MEILFMSKAWDDYLYWQKTNKKVSNKVNELIKQCIRTPFEDIGKPEPLKETLSGWWSRRITGEHRLIYKIDNKKIVVLQCRYHY